MRLLWILLSALSVAAVTADHQADPREVADELRAALLAGGPFRAVYEVARPAEDRVMTLEVEADLPRRCLLISGSGDDQVHAYADAVRQRLLVLGRREGAPVLVRTDGAPLRKAVADVRQAFLTARLGDEETLPGLTADASADAATGLRLFAAITLGPAVDPRGEPYIKSGAGLTVASETNAGSWLAELVADTQTSIQATETTYRLSQPQGTMLTLSRETGLPTAARVKPRDGRDVTLTLKRFERLAAFVEPDWAAKPPADLKTEDLTLPEHQRRIASLVALAFYVLKSVEDLVRRPGWRDDLGARREAIVAALEPQAACLWQDRGRGVARGLVLVLRGATIETERRLRYLREPDAEKARAVALQYAAEALARRAEMLDEALDAVLDDFRRHLPRKPGADESAPANAVLAELLILVQEAARRAYLAEAARTIANEVVNERVRARN